jgi:hypothetical protein
MDGGSTYVHPYCFLLKYHYSKSSRNVCTLISLLPLYAHSVFDLLSLLHPSIFFMHNVIQIYALVGLTPLDLPPAPLALPERPVAVEEVLEPLERLVAVAVEEAPGPLVLLVPAAEPLVPAAEPVDIACKPCTRTAIRSSYESSTNVTWESYVMYSKLGGSILT